MDAFLFAPKLGILQCRFLRMQNYRLHLAYCIVIVTESVKSVTVNFTTINHHLLIACCSNISAQPLGIIATLFCFNIIAAKTWLYIMLDTHS